MMRSRAIGSEAKGNVEPRLADRAIALVEVRREPGVFKVITGCGGAISFVAELQRELRSNWIHRLLGGRCRGKQTRSFGRMQNKVASDPAIIKRALFGRGPFAKVKITREPGCSGKVGSMYPQIIISQRVRISLLKPLMIIASLRFLSFIDGQDHG